MDDSPPVTEKRMRVDAAQFAGARLVCTHGLCQPAGIALGDAPIVIGRGAQADIVVGASQISRTHASIKKTAHGFTIEDIDSRNGTFVNAEPVRGTPRLLQNGDEIALASVVVLRFVCEDARRRLEQPARQGVVIDPQRHDVIVDGIVVEPPLSTAQFALLALLHKRAGAIVARAEIAREIWPDAAPNSISADAVDCLIKRMRARIRAIGDGNNYVDVVRGHGVRLNGKA
jgi:pSer/pThr/pTyr-binding forkhead associated (FHA) protein